MMLRAMAFILSFAAAAAAAAQSCPAPDGAQKVESDRYVLSYRTRPARLAVGQHFSVDLQVCPKAGQPAPDGVRVDGFMPEHNHGMNYKAVVKPAGSGRYEVSGLMFHMAGKWDFIFEIRGAGRTDRVTHSVTLE